MSTITIKNLPPSVHQALKARAKSNGRSLNKEVIATLEGTLHSTPIDADAVAKHAQAVRETLGVYLTERDLHDMKNAGRR